MGRSSNYSIELQAPDHVVIRDLGPWDKYVSVTNNAEEVVLELFAKGVLTQDKRLFYFDSDGELDEIAIEGGEFAGFKPGPKGGKL